MKLLSMKKIREYAWPPNIDSYIELILRHLILYEHTRIEEFEWIKYTTQWSVAWI